MTGTWLLSRRDAAGALAGAWPTAWSITWFTTWVGAARGASALSRPHATFTQSQDLPWTEDPQWRAPRRVLGPTRGAVVKLPPGYTLTTPREYARGLAALVVTGAVDINGRTLGRQTFLREPAGFVMQSCASSDGATLLTIDESGGSSISVNTWDLPWSPSAPFAWPLQPEGTAPATFWKGLAEGPQTGAVTALWSSLPLQGLAEARAFAFAADVELFMLQGALADVSGAMLAVGGYAHFKAGTSLGPWHTHSGFVALVRTSGGAQASFGAPASRGAGIAAPPSAWTT